MTSFHWRFLWCVSALALMLAACGRDAQDEAQAARPVRAIVIEKSKLGETIELTGVIQPENEVALSFRIGGRIVERLVGTGDAVKAGQLLARLDSQNEMNALRSAQARLAAAQGRSREARNIFAREQSLLARRYTTKTKFDQALTAVETAKSDIEDATAQLKIVQDNVSYTELKSDVPGTIVARAAEAGEVVQPGQMIFRLARTGGWDAVFDAPARILRDATRDARVDLALTDDRSVTAVGRVRQVDPQADPATRTFRVRVTILSPPPAMRLGATVSGRIRLDPKAAIAIPASALTETDGQPSVWVVDRAAMTVSLRRIKVSRFSSDVVIVTEGLKAEDTIVTAGVQALHPGQKVRLLEARE
ncbi:efflux RND transporter periplasmic adaptor subunit [Methylocystis sp. WRRC1]|uniref:efflux RND transporter periplasmic adaptor subunit n=1 Tax=Methylocystis sp. WRRC1 TaxID=1732014 RepID=UPI001D15855C|nr:efflux RND transporter periplasmic adaptor subunit [Methylocystis sp. WRRC1]MCC3245062.1 efflux RND transporter periplasmic adaptor subunit [Methylocystis sp. WRRC1]